MAELTKEWLQKAISQNESMRDEIPFGWDEDDINMLEALRIALASLEAEPVAYVDPFAFNNFSVYRAGETDNKRMGREWMWANPDAGLIPVYTAPPAPVSVMDEAQSRELFEKNCMANIERNKWHPDLYAHLPAREQWAAWEACRAAMLQGADGNSPDGWVACSEQMPHIGVPVITCCGDVVQYAAYAWDGKEWQDWYEEYDKLPANTFTHWHPRPAAPQQEAKNV